MRESRPGVGAQRNHQFDLLRIVFATLVILSHASELSDGNRSREIFTHLTHSDVTFGTFGVDGFFLLSGYLIVRSWQLNPDLFSFLRNRVLRIFPGYIVATLLSTLVVGLLAPDTVHFFRKLDFNFVRSIFNLSGPITPLVFPGLPFHLANGSLWSILYEFRCYAIVALLGLCGLIRRPVFWLASTVLLLGLMVPPELPSHLPWPSIFYSVIGDPGKALRLTTIYFVGGSFYIFRSHIPFRRLLALAAGLALVCGCLLNPYFVEPGLVLFGGYLLFYFGQLSIRRLDWMKNVPDISYGIYLYGWPVTSLWIWYHRSSPWVTFLASALISFGLGWLSWHFVEGPMLKLKRRKPAPSANAQAQDVSLPARKNSWEPSPLTPPSEPS